MTGPSIVRPGGATVNTPRVKSRKRCPKSTAHNVRGAVERPSPERARALWFFRRIGSSPLAERKMGNKFPPVQNPAGAVGVVEQGKAVGSSSGLRWGGVEL